MPTTVNVNEAGYDLDAGGSTGSISSGTVLLAPASYPTQTIEVGATRYGNWGAWVTLSTRKNASDGVLEERIRIGENGLFSAPATPLKFEADTGQLIRFGYVYGSRMVVGHYIDYGGQFRSLAVSDTPAIVAQAYAGTANAFEAWDSGYNVIASISNTGAIKQAIASGAGDPTSTNFASGSGGWWKNTTANEIRFWYNDGGTMKKSAALT